MLSGRELCGVWLEFKSSLEAPQLITISREPKHSTALPSTVQQERVASNIFAKTVAGYCQIVAHVNGSKGSNCFAVQHEQHVYFTGFDSDGERAAPSSALITRGLVNT